MNIDLDAAEIQRLKDDSYKDMRDILDELRSHEPEVAEAAGVAVGSALGGAASFTALYFGGSGAPARADHAVEVLSTPERGLGRRETRGNDGVRWPHSTDGVDDVARRIHPPDPQPRQAVGPGERAQHDDVPARIDEVESGLVARTGGKLGVCLFDDQHGSLRKTCSKPRRPPSSRQVPVGLAGLTT